MSCRFLFVLILAVAAFSEPRPSGRGTTGPEDPPKEQAPALRLPATVRPIRNAAQLTITPGSPSFNGHIDIDLDVRESRNVLWLNATDLKITTATINGQPAQVVEGTKNVVGLAPKQPMTPGPAKVSIDYTGTISTKSSAGVFELEEGGNKYVYTQFEPTDARRAFPCFDEPSFKSPWQITLDVPDNLGAFANTPEASSKPAGAGRKRVEFKTTRPLPSYLVAFAVGPFEIVDAGRGGKKKTPLRILVPKGHAGEAEYARTAIPQILGELENYFGIPYPYEKLDSVVMPIANFAMENVGLITYGQSLLLAKPGQDSINRRRGCAHTVAHEMAHQWFGDLVTTAWWDDIWLNEAFATWTDMKIIEKWQPDWDVDVERVQDRLGAMGLDSVASARAIRQPIQSDSDIANAFDGITYQKGAATIRMFEQWLGPEKFRKGVQNYLKQHADGTATETDFLGAISAAAGKNIAPAFESFLNQPGTPAISVELQCDSDKPRLALTQKRFLPLGSETKGGEHWLVPFCVAYEQGGEVKRACELMTDPSQQMALPGKTCPAWVLPNDGANGYYRIIYKGDLLDRILEKGGAPLTTPEEVSMLGDVRALVRSGQMPAEQALALVPRFAAEKKSDVVEGAISITNLISATETPDDLQAKRAAFIRTVFGPRAHQLGWAPKQGESDDDQFLRQRVVPLVAGAGDDRELAEQARTLAEGWLRDRKGIDPNMLGSVLHAAASHGGAKLFDQFLAAARDEKNPHLRETIIGALGAFRDPALARRAMDLILAKTFDIRESYGLLFDPMQYRATEKLPFEFVKENLPKLLQVLPREVGGDFAAGLVGTGEPFCSADDLRQVQDFFGPKVKDWTGADRQLAHVVENIRQCMARRESILPSYARGLDAAGTASGSQSAVQ